MQNKKYGFTLVEIIIVVTVIGILSTIGVFSYMGIQANSRDYQRKSRATIIASSLEKYYESNGDYPTCPDFADNPSSFLTDVKSDVLSTPTSTSETSLICSDGEPSDSTIDVYTYQYDNTNKSWKLWYISETNKSMDNIQSKHSNP